MAKKHVVKTNYLGGLGMALWFLWAGFVAVIFMTGCASAIPDGVRGVLIQALTTDVETFRTTQQNLCYEGGVITLNGTSVGNVGESSLEEVLGGWKVIADTATVRNYAIVDNCLVMLPKEVE